MLRLLGLDSAAVPWIAGVGLVTVLLLAVLVAIARRRRDYASVSIAMIVAAWGGVALASVAAVGMFNRTLEEMSRLGGGIAALAYGFSEAARVPLSAMWIALAATLLAIFFATRSVRNEPRPSRAPFVPWMAALGAVAAGTGAVLLFRDAMAFVLELGIPGADPALLGGRSMADAISMRLLTAGAGSAVCFAVALALMIAMLRRRAAPLRILVPVLIVSIAVAMAMIADLGTYSNRWHDVAVNGDGLQTLLPERALRE